MRRSSSSSSARRIVIACRRVRHGRAPRVVAAGRARSWPSRGGAPRRGGRARQRDREASRPRPRAPSAEIVAAVALDDLAAQREPDARARRRRRAGAGARRRGRSAPRSALEADAVVGDRERDPVGSPRDRRARPAPPAGRPGGGTSAPLAIRFCSSWRICERVGLDGAAARRSRRVPCVSWTSPSRSAATTSRRDSREVDVPARLAVGSSRG